MSEDVPPPAVPPAAPPQRPRRLAREFRWQAFFQQADEPIFVLDRRQRLLFVNRAWETLTGLSAAQAHVLRCRRPRPSSPGDSLEDVLAHALTPPPQALQGTTARVRRLLPALAPTETAEAASPVGGPTAQRQPSWWEVEFLPLRQGGKLGGYLLLGRIHPLPASGPEGPVRLPEAVVNLRQQLAARFSLDRVTSTVPAMRRVLDQVGLAAQITAPVLLVGEAGTGKETLARVIHHTGHGRERPFAALSCTRLPDSVLSALLFGKDRPGVPALGTVYLKEPAQLPRDLQMRLRELLAARAANPEREGVRILAGSRRPLAEEVQAGRMLEELACALTTLVIEVPPLRQRLPDLPVLVEQLLERINDLTGAISPAETAAPRRVQGVTAAAWTVLNAHPWPGNLRELYTVLLGAAEHAPGERIDVADLPAALRLLHRLEPVPGQLPERMPPLKATLEKVERRLIERALLRARGNKSEAAELLGIWRALLWRRMKALDIPDPEGEQRMKRSKRKQEDEEKA